MPRFFYVFIYRQTVKPSNRQTVKPSNRQTSMSILPITIGFI